jgi:hypothetical protein
MPAYNTKPAIALTPGDTENLVNSAATDSGVTTTQQVHIGPSGTASGTRVHVSNTTNQSCTIQATSVADATGNYKALTDAETAEAIVVASGTDAYFDPAVCWLRGLFGTAPTSGYLTISR